MRLSCLREGRPPRSRSTTISLEFLKRTAILAFYDGSMPTTGISLPVTESHSRMLGILVSGDNHFIVQGPAPDPQTAVALVRHWTIIRIGAPAPLLLARWQIIS